MRIRDTTKEELVKKRAIMVLGKEGFEGFSMNKLAKACGISVATLYIYYRDKDDLIIAIATEEMEKMNAAVLDGFDPAMPFAEGLRVQWKNRAGYMLAHPEVSLFAEQLRSSTYHQSIFPVAMKGFANAMGKFMKNAVKNKEIDPMPLEVFWSIAYGPLYTLLRFSNEGRSIGGRPFSFSNKILWQTFDRVLMALAKK
ncbi:TetR/AcrR family transcriptional regulator [Terrimonas sp. NA20]|uniref:TetR/AcrR family transcriptional regulator n=1 Tax=Terrimonas ginsenosidimutans TaxID=2908004 RepID=A0ABS9KZU6_9BACT|nr:TetR/AcrR family transcriptional regulator [Terrimonas ginsenosidimutans]MCG2617855.1 TetR/AcrR family transcriptional regulator [Terrimonas ginsenosidimutans]